MARSPSAHRSALRTRLEMLEQRSLMAASQLVPLAGDFDGDGTDTVALYDQTDGRFLITNQNATGFADIGVRFGPRNPTAVPLVGDWDGDGDDTPGIYLPTAGLFLLKNSLNPGAADLVLRFGPKNSSLLPLAGDWDGDGDDTPGLYQQNTGKFFLRNSNSSGPADLSYGFGPKNQTWQPVVGDWNNSGDENVAVFRAATDEFFLRFGHSGGPADATLAFDGGTDVKALAGDWNGDGNQDAGVFDHETGRFSLRNSLTPGPADTEFYLAPLVDPAPPPVAPLSAPCELTTAEVEALLARAAAASASDDAIIAVVDRAGRILGVRAEQGVLDAIADPEILAFAIDGAVAKARTAAFFSTNAAPLTSRTIRFISQSTITQREVEANPNSSNSLVRGPGFVAPIGLGGHFPPGIAFTPPVDLFAIEHSNRDSIVHAGSDHVRDTLTLNPDGSVATVSGDDILLPARFNADPLYLPFPPSDFLTPPEAYGFVSGTLPNAQSRGMATLPGGIPLFKNCDGDSQGLGDTLVGGIGVFFPGPDGYATHEQAFIAGIGQSEAARTNAPRVLEAEWIAFAAAGGSKGASAAVGTLGTEPALANFDLPFGRIDLVGIKLEIYGPHPTGVGGVITVGNSVGRGSATSGANLPVTVGGDFYLAGEAMPEGWLVLPHDSPVGDLSALQVGSIIDAGIAEAELVRAAIRLPLGSRTQMALAVADTQGNLLGLYRMPDSTVFSLDVAVAKARNTAYYAKAAIALADRVDGSLPPDGVPDLPAGVAFTNRTFRFLAEARFPDGVEGTSPGPFSILRDPGTNPATAENFGAPAAAGSHTSVLGFDAFNAGTNFRDTTSPVANQNGVVFFPGATPLYASGTLRGGLGVSGDGVDQDDVVTFFGAQGFLPPNPLRADEFFVRGVRLPFFKFNRNPEA